MIEDRTITSLPESDDYWSKVDNKESKDFLNCILIEKIRGSIPSDDQQRIELLAQLKLCVELIDSPRAVYNNIKTRQAEFLQKAELEELVTE